MAIGFIKHPVFQAIIVAISYYALGQIAVRFTIMPEGIATFWPPNAVVVAALVLSPVRRWWWFLLAGIIAEFAADYGFYPLWQISGFGVVNALEALLTATIVRRWALNNQDFVSLNVRIVTVLGVVFLFVSTPVAALGGGTLYLLGDPSVDFLSFWRLWWFGDATALMILAPFFLVWAGEPIPDDLKWRKSGFELAALLTLVVGVGGIVFFAQPSWPDWLKAPSLMLTAIVWGALRFGLHGSTSISVLIAFMAAIGTTQGYGPFLNAATPEAAVLAVQEYILVAVILSLSLGVTFRQLKWSMAALEKERQLLEERVEERTEELQAAWEVAEKRAQTDSLTELNNRRAFFGSGSMIFGQAKRYERPMSVIMLDIDLFKTVNDTYGHATGDAVLIAIAEIITMTARSADICGRLGGEEFAVCLPETSLTNTLEMAERLRKSISEHTLSADKGEFCVTASLGVAELMESDDKIDDIIRRADDALYEAKRNGRNRVQANPSSVQS